MPWLNNLSERMFLTFLYPCVETNRMCRAGGAYFEPPMGHVYEISESDLKSGGWKESVQNYGSYRDQPDHRRNTSNGSIEGGDGTMSPPEQPSGGGNLTVPSASVNHSRRSGRSPLARVSLLRSTSDEGTAIELQDQTSRPQS